MFLYMHFACGPYWTVLWFWLCSHTCILLVVLCSAVLWFWLRFYTRIFVVVLCSAVPWLWLYAFWVYILYSTVLWLWLRFCICILVVVLCCIVLVFALHCYTLVVVTLLLCGCASFVIRAVWLWLLCCSVVVVALLQMQQQAREVHGRARGWEVRLPGRRDARPHGWPWAGCGPGGRLRWHWDQSSRIRPYQQDKARDLRGLPVTVNYPVVPQWHVMDFLLRWTFVNIRKLLA